MAVHEVDEPDSGKDGVEREARNGAIREGVPASGQWSIKKPLRRERSDRSSDGGSPCRSVLMV